MRNLIQTEFLSDPSLCWITVLDRSQSWWDRTEDELQQLESQMGNRMFGGTQFVEVQQDGGGG